MNRHARRKERKMPRKADGSNKWKKQTNRRTNVQKMRKTRQPTNRTRCSSRHAFRMQLQPLPRGLPPPYYYRCILVVMASIALSSRSYPHWQRETRKETTKRTKKEKGSRKQNKKPLVPGIYKTTVVIGNTRSGEDAARERNKNVAGEKLRRRRERERRPFLHFVDSGRTSIIADVPSLKTWMISYVCMRRYWMFDNLRPKCCKGRSGCRRGLARFITGRETFCNTSAGRAQHRTPRWDFLDIL